MQRESNEHLKKIIIAINIILEENQIPITPHNIIKYTITSIISMLDNKDTKNVKDLLSVIFIYQDFIQENVDALLCKLIENNFEDKAFRIIKILLNSEREVHIEILLKYYLKGVNKSKMYNMINYCLDKCEDTRAMIDSIEKSMSQHEELDNLKIINTFFERIFPQIDFKERISRSIDFIEHTGDFKTKEEHWKGVLGVLFKYSTWLGEIDTVGKDQEFYTREIQYIIDILYKTQENSLVQSTLVLRILAKIVEVDRIYYCRSNLNVVDLNKKTKKLIKDVVFHEETSFKSIEEFFKAAKHFIVPNFIEITRELCDKFNNESQEKVVPILKTIACHIGVLELTTIMNNQMNYIKWIPILSATSNNDLSIFLEIYSRVEEKEKVYALIPSFCNYSTDHNNKIDAFLEIIIECLNNKMYYSVACNGLRNLITSHEINLSKTCFLRNQIDKSTSLKILEKACSPKIFFEILRNFNNEQLPKEVLLVISKKLKGEEISRTAEALVGYTLNYPDSSPLVVQGMAVSDIKECLNITKFFIPSAQFSIDFTSKLLELCSSDNPQVQKKAYELLYYLEKESRIEICVCEHVNGKDTVSCLKASSLKYKLMYLTVLRVCSCGVDKKSFLFQNVILSFSPRGNISSRRVAEDVLDSVFLGTNSKESALLLDYILKGMKSNNLEIVSGCISAFSYILERYSTTIPFETQITVYSFVCGAFKSVNALVIIKSLSTFIKHTEGLADDNVTKILEFYVDNKKRKYRTDIKEVVHTLLHKQMAVSRKLKRYTNFRIPTNRQTLTITKNNEIILTEETRKD